MSSPKQTYYLEELRQKQGRSRQGLARACKINTRNFWNWEHRGMPPIRRYRAQIALVLNVPVDSIRWGEGWPDRPVAGTPEAEETEAEEAPVPEDLPED